MVQVSVPVCSVVVVSAISTHHTVPPLRSTVKLTGGLPVTDSDTRAAHSLLQNNRANCLQHIHLITMGRKIKAFDPFNPNPAALQRYNGLVDRTKDGRSRNMPIKASEVNKVPKSLQWLQTSIQYTKLQEAAKHSKLRKPQQGAAAAAVPVSKSVQRLQSALERKKQLRAQHRQQQTLPELKQLPGETYYAYVQRVRAQRDSAVKQYSEEHKHDNGTLDGSEVQQKRVEKQYAKLLKRRQRQAEQSRGGVDAVQSTRLTKRQRHEERVQGEPLRDSVQFGERVDRPPTLTVKPKLSAKRQLAAAQLAKPKLQLSERQLERERQVAIETYKKMKQKQSG